MRHAYELPDYVERNCTKSGYSRRPQAVSREKDFAPMYHKQRHWLAHFPVVLAPSASYRIAWKISVKKLINWEYLIVFIEEELSFWQSKERRWLACPLPLFCKRGQGLHSQRFIFHRRRQIFCSVVRTFFCQQINRFTLITVVCRLTTARLPMARKELLYTVIVV